MTDAAHVDQPGQAEPGHLEALRQIARARQELEERENVHVLQARAAGASWEDIASALGVTRQAAHRRFRTRAAHAAARRPDPG